MKLSIVLVAEATEDFAAMLRLNLWSIRTNAGALSDAPITVVFNEREDGAFSAELRERFEARTVVAPRISTSLRFTNKWNCFRAPEIEHADWMVFLDCDTVVTAPLDPLREWLASTTAEFASAPEQSRQAWRLDRTLRQVTGRTPEEIEAFRHPDFVSDGYPVFNIGVFAVRGAAVPALAHETVRMSKRLHAKMRATTLNPIQWMKVQWNRRFWKRRRHHHLVIGSYFPRIHTNQVAIGATLLHLGMKYALLPPEFNWRNVEAPPDSRRVRILHYLGARFPIGEKGAVLRGDWLDRFSRSEHPGWRLLAEQVRAYKSEVAYEPSFPVRPEAAQARRGSSSDRMLKSGGPRSPI